MLYHVHWIRYVIDECTCMFERFVHFIAEPSCWTLDTRVLGYA